MARWVAHLKRYDFSVRHISDRLHIIPAGLSSTSFNSPAPAEDEPSDNHLSPSQTFVLQTASQSLPTFPTADLPFHADHYSARFRLLGFWLASGGFYVSVSSLSRPERRRIRSQLALFFSRTAVSLVATVTGYLNSSSIHLLPASKHSPMPMNTSITGKETLWPPFFSLVSGGTAFGAIAWPMLAAALNANSALVPPRSKHSASLLSLA
ncbi:hypothetical protein CF327_g6837 [Tilletia walkeri]|uniref:Uncharacterized protein n=1 Tax=Tilletia walkeri TaxID=117179 RepID=A0A8X7N3D9_9BASI|nr:hypothetical protein CF327_g6837 [Tilletia walkeri]KAE8265571.1 hypothetical protein A4X09_0g6606 [Tilletia walkeri]